MRIGFVVLCGGIALGSVACGSSPTTPTVTPTSTATIESVVTSFRGAIVESNPVVIESRTTSYVYVGLAEGTVPWPLTGPSTPRVGDIFGSNRVLATSQLARTVTFR